MSDPSLSSEHKVAYSANLSFHQQLDSSLASRYYPLRGISTVHHLEYFNEVIKPFMVHSITGTLLSWDSTMRNHEFLYAGWFHHGGFRELFMHTLETAFTRLPFQRVILHEHVNPANLIKDGDDLKGIDNDLHETILFWEYRPDYKVAFIGCRRYGASSLYESYLDELRDLPSEIWNGVQNNLSSWAWNYSTKKKTYTAYSKHNVDGISFHEEDKLYIYDYSNMYLNVTITNEDSTSYQTKSTARRTGAKPLNYPGLKYYLTKTITDNRPSNSPDSDPSILMRAELSLLQAQVAIIEQEHYNKTSALEDKFTSLEIFTSTIIRNLVIRIQQYESTFTLRKEFEDMDLSELFPPLRTPTL